MARMSSAMAVVLMLLVIVGTSSVVNADCSQYNIQGLSPCSASVMPGGSPPSYASPCCVTLRTWGYVCLCNVLAKSGSVNNLPPSVDATKVLALPQDCGLTVPSGYNCAGYTFP